MSNRAELEMTKKSLVNRLICIGRKIAANDNTSVKAVADYVSSLGEQFPELNNDDLKSILYQIFYMKD